MKKNIAGIIGLFLLVGFFVGGGYQYLGDWSNAEMVGYNFMSLIQIIGGGWLVYYGMSNRKLQN